MFLLDWYREWKTIKVCQSCETLKLQLDIANMEKKQLLDRVLEPPREREVVEKEPVQVSLPRTIPWKVRQQILEREDREVARARREAAKPDTISTEDLEKELKVVEQIREERK